MAMTREQRSAAAKLGWERRKARQAAAEAAKAKRSAAARKGWETRRKRQQAQEMAEEWEEEQRRQQEQQQIDELMEITEGEMIDLRLREILANGEGGRALADALITALDELRAEIGDEEYYKNIASDADLILDRAEKIVYKYEYNEKTTYAQAIYKAASGGGLIPDDILIDVYDAANSDRRKQYGQTHPDAKQRGPYNKRR